MADTQPTTDTAAPDDKAPEKKSSESESLTAELEAAVDDKIAERKGEPDPKPEASEPPKGDPAPKDKAPADDAGQAADDDDDESDDDDDDEGEGEGDDEGEPDPVPLSNQLQERAVRAGMSLEEIKQFPSEGLLSKTVDRIEGAGRDTGSPGGAGGQGGEAKPDTVADRLASLPALDPEVVDEEIVTTFEAMKGIIQQLSDENKSILGSQAKDWISAKLEGVKDLTKGDADKIAAVQSRFDVLKAGYAATGKSVSDDKVFEEAASLALGAETAQTSRKRSAAGKRSKLLIQRPSGHRVKGNPDARDEMAAILDRKHFSG